MFLIKSTWNKNSKFQKVLKKKNWKVSQNVVHMEKVWWIFQILKKKVFRKEYLRFSRCLTIIFNQAKYYLFVWTLARRTHQSIKYLTHTSQSEKYIMKCSRQVAIKSRSRYARKILSLNKYTNSICGFLSRTTNTFIYLVYVFFGFFVIFFSSNLYESNLCVIARLDCACVRYDSEFSWSTRIFMMRKYKYKVKIDYGNKYSWYERTNISKYSLTYNFLFRSS